MLGSVLGGLQLYLSMELPWLIIAKALRMYISELYKLALRACLVQILFLLQSGILIGYEIVHLKKAVSMKRNWI